MKFALKYRIYLSVALFFLMPQNLFASSPLKVYVSILPQKYFIERIGHTKVIVDVLVAPGKSPATFSPSPDQIRKLISSDLYFRIGVPFENSIIHKLSSLSSARIVDTRQGIELRTMTDTLNGKEGPDSTPIDDHQDAASSDHDGHHSHDGKDPHIWMSPTLVKIQALTILNALSAIDPDNSNTYKTNYDLFIKDLDVLDRNLRTVLKNLKGENLFVFHPSFGYFTDTYGLNQIAVETMGKAPKGKALSSLIKLAKVKNARVIFVQPQFDPSAAQKIASAINGAVVSIDPLAYDYIANMQTIADTIAKALEKQPL